MEAQFWGGGVTCDSDQGCARNFRSRHSGFRDPGQVGKIPQLVNSGPPRVCQVSPNFAPGRWPSRNTSQLWRQLVCYLARFRGYTGHETQTTGALVVAECVKKRKGNAMDPKIGGVGVQFADPGATMPDGRSHFLTPLASKRGGPSPIVRATGGPGLGRERKFIRPTPWLRPSRGKRNFGRG